jgi:hypothetical protein
MIKKDGTLVKKLEEILRAQGVDEKLIKRAGLDFFYLFNNELTPKPLKKDELKTLVDALDKVEYLYEFNFYREYLRYKDHIEKYYDKYESWPTLSEIEDEYYPGEDEMVYEDAYALAFLNMVEENEEKKINNGKEIQKATGIWFNDKDEKDITAKERKQGVKEAVGYFNDLYINAKVYLYTHVMEALIEDGAVWDDLIDVLPEQYGLKEPWECKYFNITSQYESIGGIIYEVYDLDKSSNRYLPLYRPSLREVAEDLKAPLGVVIDAYKIFNGGGGKTDEEKAQRVKLSIEKMDEYRKQRGKSAKSGS